MRCGENGGVMEEGGRGGGRGTQEVWWMIWEEGVRMEEGGRGGDGL